MATVTEDSANRSLWSELLAGSLYKQKQGRIVRQLTCLAIWLAVWLGAWRLYETMGAGDFASSAPRYLIPGAVVALGMWFAFRLVNWPRFADFLISVEAEMSKVSWPSRTELYRASMVVIFTMAFLAILLFCYDCIWRFLFDLIGVS